MIGLNKFWTLYSYEGLNTHYNTTFPVTTALPVVETITIAVSVSNKTIRLPESSSSLTAFTVPAPTKDNPFSYEWKAQESNLQGTGLPTKDETIKTT